MQGPAVAIKVFVQDLFVQRDLGLAIVARQGETNEDIELLFIGSHVDIELKRGRVTNLSVEPPELFVALPGECPGSA